MAKLAYFMHTDRYGGTYISDVNPGIIDYMEFKGYNNFVATKKTYPSFSDCEYEVIRE